MRHRVAQADVPEIQASGRTERGPDGWRATWPAVAWCTAFSGTSVSVLTQDASAYHVEIDGREMDSIAPSEQRTESWYRGVPSGDHLIEIIRKNVTRTAPGQFFGFKLESDDRWLPPPARLARQIEFIGDSHSAAYGDLSTSPDCDDDAIPSLSDASRSYAVLTAKQIHADWQLNAMYAVGLARAIATILTIARLPWMFCSYLVGNPARLAGTRIAEYARAAARLQALDRRALQARERP